MVDQMVSIEALKIRDNSPTLKDALVLTASIIRSSRDVTVAAQFLCG